MNARQLGEQLQAKRQEWKTLWDSKADKSFTDDEISTLTQLNAAMTDIAAKYETAAALEETAARTEREIKEFDTPVNSLPTPQAPTPQAQYKSFRDRLSESQELRQFKAGNVKQAQIHLPDEVLAREFGMKTLLTTGDWDIPAMRLPQTVESVQLPITVSDLMLSGTTTSPTITYMEETTFTNNAAEVAEGGTKPESALDFTLRTDNVRKIATWIPATDEMLEDVPQMESYIRARLPFMVVQRREQQLISGDGTAPNISGILDRTGLQTQAKGADPTPDAVYKAMTKVRVTAGAEPTAVLFHPNDWQEVRLLRTTDGIYIWGNPSEAGPERIWGLTVRQTTGLTEGTALTGAFRPYAQVFRRSGITITISTEHSTYFTENKVAILAEERIALAVYRPSAFVSITGV